MRHLRWMVFFMIGCLSACGGADANEPPPEEPIVEDEEPSEPAGESEPPGDEPAQGGRTSPDGMCGGIAGFTCPEGQWCDMQAHHPDASGTCRPEGECDEPADCERQDIPHAMCVGEWVCQGGRCGWECS